MALLESITVPPPSSEASRTTTGRVAPAPKSNPAPSAMREPSGLTLRNEGSVAPTTRPESSVAASVKAPVPTPVSTYTPSPVAAISRPSASAAPSVENEPDATGGALIARYEAP